MHEQGLLKSKNALIRPAHNESYAISHGRKIVECYNLIALKFIVEDLTDESEKGIKNKMDNMKVLSRQKDVVTESTQSGNICGK